MDPPTALSVTRSLPGLGRKNWLFSRTPKGASASAAIYSPIETAKANRASNPTAIYATSSPGCRSPSAEPDYRALLPTPTSPLDEVASAM